MTTKVKKRRGDVSYKKAGFTKPILIHLDPGVHSKLKKHAEKEDRSLQVTARRILEEWAEKKVA